MSRTYRRHRRNRLLSITSALAMIAVLLLASPASAGSPKQFTFVFENGATITGTSDDNTVFLADAGGTDAANPTGMDVHVSCSDEFPGGFGEKDGPDPVVDSAWRIESFSIGEVKDGVFREKCNGPVDAGDPAAVKKGNGYTFTFVNGVTISGASEDNTAFLPGAGGNDPANPIGMEVHVSCSDEFPGGFGEKDGPDPVRDSAWQIESFEITKIKDFRVEEVKCTGSFAPPAPPPAPSIDLTKTVNGEDANTAPGVTVEVGSTVTLGYLVENTGNITVSDIVVTDLDLGTIPCPQSSLAPGESMSCDEQQMDVVEEGPVFMEARVDGVGEVRGTPTPPTPNKGKGYSFTFVNGVTISGVSEDNTVFLPGAGGTDPANPIGMEVHVSCSDDFPGGFGEKDGPDPVRDPAWQIAAFTIVKSDGKTCGEVFETVSVPVSDEDPINYIAVGDPPPSLLPPENCSAVVMGDSVKISWDASDGAETYAVRRDRLFLGRTGGATMFTDTPPAGVMVEYTVRAIGPDAKTDYVSCGKVTVPDDPDPSPSIDLMKTIDGLDAQTAPGPEYSVGDTVVIGYKVTNTGDTVLSNLVLDDDTFGEFPCAIDSLDPGESTSCAEVDEVLTTPGPVTMRAEVEGTSPEGVVVTDDDPINFVVVEDPPPSLLPPENCSAVVMGDSVKISWDASDGAETYAVRRDRLFLGRTGGATMFTDTPPAGVMVEYTVRAIGPDDRTDYVSCGKVTVPDDPGDPSAPEQCSASSTPDGTLISWTPVDGAKAYQVRVNGKWQVRTTELSWLDEHPRSGYTVEAVFPGGVKSDRTSCSSSN